MEREETHESLSVHRQRDFFSLDLQAEAAEQPEAHRRLNPSGRKTGSETHFVPPNDIKEAVSCPPRSHSTLRRPAAANRSISRNGTFGPGTDDDASGGHAR